MKLYGVMGFPLSHTFSEKYFTEKFKNENITDTTYKTFPLEEISEFPKMLQMFPELCGLNVTLPHKEKVINYLDEISPVAKEIGAVNTIKILHQDGKNYLKGFNTDCYGFYNSLKPLLKPRHQKALVLGAGGASKAVVYVLKQLEIDYTMVVRSPYENEKTLFYVDLTKEIIENHKIIINTTPLGMYPYIEMFPQIPYEYLTSEHLLYDLIYNPEESQFLKFGKLYKAQVMNGLKMLHLQAERSWAIFTGNEDVFNKSKPF